MIRLPDRSNPNRFATVEVRLEEFMLHSTRYAFNGLSKVARDAGVSVSALSLVLSGKRRPNYILVTRVVAALEAALGVTIDPREVVAENGAFPTASVCEVVGCRGKHD